MDTAHAAEQLTQVADPLLLAVPILPLIGALLVFVLTNRSTKSHVLSGWMATIFSFCAFACVVKLFLVLAAGNSAVTAFAWHWMVVRPFTADFSFRFDHLSAVMSLVITGVGSLIHLYAIGYMDHDKHRPRFFCYLNLFLFAMLLLVLGDNLLVLFVGWEGVGLCSYLLIGFWFKEMPNAQAGQKAFIVNRIGDAGFLLGMFTLFVVTGSITFAGIQAGIGDVSSQVIELAAILLFVGAIGKSAQIPLYIWLPDAMAGPTPVSALIHAATMVTAGVYMITRMSFLYAAAPLALSVIMVVGTATALLAATIALVQNDIKKVLAYSTVSQLGYMFMALGAGAFSNGIYHVVTHAFFKACLFMAAGSVIMGCHHEQDMRHYGGLWKKMPLTFVAYIVATFAIAGFPGLSGFYSKDQILWTVYSSTGRLSQMSIAGMPLNQLCWALGVITAFLTAFYMTRSLMMTFFGKYRGHSHPHESPWVVTLPILILGALSAVFAAMYGEHLLHYLAPWTRADINEGHAMLEANPLYHLLERISIIVAISGMSVGALFYSVWAGIPRALAGNLKAIYQALLNKWWVDELYDSIVVQPLRALADFFFRGVDRAVIDDGFVNGSAFFVEANGEIARRAHTGQTRSYAAIMFLAMFFLTVFYLLFQFVR